MIFALLSDSQNAEAFLDNFTEADFDLKHVSVIMKSVVDRNKLAEDAGPLKGIQENNLAAQLKTYAFTPDEISQYIHGLNKSNVFIAIDTYSDQLIISMLNDYHPELLRSISL